MEDIILNLLYEYQNTLENIGVYINSLKYRNPDMAIDGDIVAIATILHDASNKVKFAQSLFGSEWK